MKKDNDLPRLSDIQNRIVKRRDRESGAISVIPEETIIKKYGEGALKEMRELCGQDVWLRLSVSGDYRIETVKEKISLVENETENIDWSALEQSEAADKQAHADHIRETMEDR